MPIHRLIQYMVMKAAKFRSVPSGLQHRAAAAVPKHILVNSHPTACRALATIHLIL
jgi:hypothetical protein